MARLEARFRLSPMGVHLLTCKEVEDENADYKDENDWGSGGRELRPTIAGIVCIKAIDQSGQHCYNTRERFLTGFLLTSLPNRPRRRSRPRPLVLHREW